MDFGGFWSLVIRGVRKIDRIYGNFIYTLHRIQNIHNDYGFMSLLPIHEFDIINPTARTLFRQRRRRRPRQLIGTALITPQLRRRPPLRQFLRINRPRKRSLMIPPLLIHPRQRRRYRSLLLQFPLLPEQQRYTSQQQYPERYANAQAHGQGVGFVSWLLNDRGGGGGGICTAGGDGRCCARCCC